MKRLLQWNKGRRKAGATFSQAQHLHCMTPPHQLHLLHNVEQHHFSLRGRGAACTLYHFTPDFTQTHLHDVEQYHLVLRVVGALKLALGGVLNNLVDGCFRIHRVWGWERGCERRRGFGCVCMSVCVCMCVLARAHVCGPVHHTLLAASQSAFLSRKHEWACSEGLQQERFKLSSASVLAHRANHRIDEHGTGS
eukprot:1158132-Pelagomonas_calceolata.AAC.3